MSMPTHSIHGTRAPSPLLPLLGLTLLAVGCAAEVGPAAQPVAVDVPPAMLVAPLPDGPCDPTRVIAYHPDIQASPPVGMVSEPLFPIAIWTEIPIQQGGQGPGLPQALVDSMLRRHILKRIDGGPLQTTDMEEIDDAEYVQVEYDCPISAMEAEVGPAWRQRLPAAVHPEAAGVDPTAKVVGAWGWHAQQTGTDQAVPLAMEILGEQSPWKVRVAVLDTGVDPAVPSLAEGWSYYTPPGVPIPWKYDIMGHGTSVASLIADATNGRAELLSVKVLNAQGRGSQIGLVNGLLWSIYHGADILNLSLGYPRDEELVWGQMPLYLVEGFQAVHASGARALAAAGNRCGGAGTPGCDAFYPAAAPYQIGGMVLGVTSVSGLSPEGKVSRAAVATQADLWAPSELICTPTSSQVNASGYQRLSGTSFAVPQVSGGLALLALVQQELNGNALTGGDLNYLINLLVGSASVVPDLPPACATGGRLNMCEAMRDITGLPYPTCQAWQGVIDPSTDSCPWVPGPDFANASATLTLRNAPPLGYEQGTALPYPVDHQEEAMWCAGTNGSSARPVCTSCEVEFSGAGGVNAFRLDMHVHGGWADFIDWQLKLVDASNNETYLALDLQSHITPGWGPFGGTIDYEATLSPPLLTTPVEAWLVSEGAAVYGWSGIQLDIAP